MDREALRKRLLASYREETRERLDVLLTQLEQVSSAGSNEQNIAEIFREIHSVKGAARAVGIRNVERVTHEWESLLADCRDFPEKLNPALINKSRAICHALQESLDSDDLDSQIAEQLIDSLIGIETGQGVSQSTKMTAKTLASTSRQNATAMGHTVRVANEQLTGLLFQAENLHQMRIKHHAYVREQQLLVQRFANLRSLQQQIDVRQHELQQILNALPESVRHSVSVKLNDYAQLTTKFQHEITPLINQLKQQHQQANQVAQGLYGIEDAMNNELEALLLIPAQQLAEGLNTTLSELASSLGKQIHFQTEFAQFTLDKRILDQLRPMLMHLLRNAVDHGIETPGERRQANKPERGQVTLKLEQVSADRLALIIQDDGQGIDRDAVKQRAVKLGLITHEQTDDLTEQQIYDLLFHDGLSTSQLITEISGRGVGMAVVQQGIERLGGQLTIRSQSGSGTEYRIVIPTRVSAFRALIIETAGHRFSIPANYVLQCLSFDSDALHSIENRPAIRWQGKLIPVWDLASLLDYQATAIADEESLNLVVAQLREQPFALLVRTVHTDEELILKAPSARLQNLFGLLGIAQRGNGELIPVLQLAELLQRARERATQLHIADDTTPANQKQHILVADDSFTSRGLLQSILEAAGYQITTANDGSEAWRLLKQQAFDLLVSDVEMPGLSGFTLTEKVRRDPALHSLPVVLVTALQSAEDQQRGLEAGAHAYLVKSSFEQDSLLDAIRRLI